MDTTILNMYSDFVFLFSGLLTFEAVLLVLLRYKSKGQETNSLLLLLLISALFGLTTYLSIIAKFIPSSNLLTILGVAVLPFSSFLYVKIFSDFLLIKDSFLEGVKNIFFLHFSFVILVFVFQLGFGFNPLFDNKLMVTDNPILISLHLEGNPTSLTLVLKFLYLFLLFAMSIRILWILLKRKEKDWLLIVGQIAIFFAGANDILLIHSSSRYALPMSFAGYILSAIRFSFHYQREYQEEILKLHRDNTQLSKVAELGYDVGQICHDLRTPLTTIALGSKVALYRLNDPSTSPEFMQNILEKICNSTDIMSSTFESYLSRIQNTDLDLTQRENIVQLIHQAIDLTSHRHDKLKGLKLDFHFQEEPIHAEVRKHDMIMVFMNLINNSLEAIEKLEEKWIKICCEKLSGQVKITFSDSGMGIPEEVAEKIFDASFSTKGSGSGLGLSFVSSVIKQHLGSIKLNTESKNTCFEMQIPLA